MADISGIKIESVNNMMSEDVTYAINKFAGYRGNHKYRGNAANK